MTILRVDGVAIAALGADLGHLAGILADLGEVGASASDFGDVSVVSSLEALLGNWTQSRVELSASLNELGVAAQSAGAAYLDVEAAVADTFSGVTR